MSFSDANVKAYVEGNTQRTKEITFHAAGQQSVTISLPSGVRFHNVSTGSTSAPSKGNNPRRHKVLPFCTAYTGK